MRDLLLDHLDQRSESKQAAGDLGFTIHQFKGPDNHFFPKYHIALEPSADDTDPYCEAGTDNWEEIGKLLINLPKEGYRNFVRTPVLSVCIADKTRPPYYFEKFRAPVLIKKIGLETGVVLSPDGVFFVTSGVYKKEKGLFVLLCRPTRFVTEVDEILREELAK